MKQTVRWGVLGNGLIARDFMIPAMLRSDICELTAVASRSQLPADYLPGVKHYCGADAYDALLADPDIDAIYMPFPNMLHADWSIKAMEMGKHVLCEKPMSCTRAEGERMVQAAEKTGKLLMEAFMYRYGDKFAVLRRILDAGTLGEIRGMQGNHGYTLDWASPAREDPALGGGCLYDVGCYVVDCMNYIMGREGATAVKAASCLRMKGGVDFHAGCSLQYDNGVTATLQSWFDAAAEQRIMITGTKGTLTIQNVFEPGDGEVILDVGGEVSKIATHDEKDLYQLEAEIFSRKLLGEDVELIPLSDTLRNLDTLELLLK